MPVGSTLVILLQDKPNLSSLSTPPGGVPSADGAFNFRSLAAMMGDKAVEKDHVLHDGSAANTAMVHDLLGKDEAKPTKIAGNEAGNGLAGTTPGPLEANDGVGSGVTS